MSVFGRLANLWKGFISLWISDVEKDHPEIAYENAINSMVEKYSALKRATAAIIRRREELAERLTSQQKELAQVTSDLNTAIETNQDDLSVVLIQKKNQLESAIADFSAAIRLNPKVALAYYHRGVAYMRQGDIVRAAEDQRRAELLDANLTKD